ncbi:hypothetical protein MNV49_006515 [Pseudohyphozyma bogoriensis]|nr:hypothetical protein MNV49_006515 [Pseudohyphozyma bogoriensis]
MSDRLITFMARRNGGVHEPEVRLIPLVFPIVIGVFSCVLFGYTYDNPEKVHWFAIPFTYAGVYYAFIAASVCGQTYLLDAYPTRAGSVLALVCSCRGVISFGLNYSLTPTTDKLGHLGTYSMYGGVMAFLGVCTLSMFWFGRRLRLFTLKFVVDKADVGPRYG